MLLPAERGSVVGASLRKTQELAIRAERERGSGERGRAGAAPPPREACGRPGSLAAQCREEQHPGFPCPPRASAGCQKFLQSGSRKEKLPLPPNRYSSMVPRGESSW